MTTHEQAVDPEAFERLAGQVISDAGGALIVPLALLGDRLGLFTALASGGPTTSGELAARTGMTERYLREWLLAMAAGGYITYQGDAQIAEGSDPRRAARYGLSPEQAEAFTNPDSPGYLVGAFQNLTAATRMLDRLTEAFHTGEGIGWHEHHSDMFEGTERFFRPGYLANLISVWIPALTGVEGQLKNGARVADVGCGLGASTIIMAQAYPRSSFVGLDHHREAIKLAPPTAGLANQAGPTRTGELALEAGFADARVATSTDFNLVYELRR